MWLARFANQGIAFLALAPALLAVPEGSDYTSDVYPEWADLKAAREALDAAIEHWLADLEPELLTPTMRYANTKGVQRAHPAWLALTHFFNHRRITGGK